MTTHAPATASVPHHRVRFTGGFWKPRLEANRQATLPAVLRHCRETGRLAAFKLDWQPGMPNPPHIFWDSDVAKWLEAVGYSLATDPDPALAAEADAAIADIARAQQADGYLNTFYTCVEPGKRWTNLRDMHELYCLGHMMEAAVAYFAGTGKRTLLDVALRMAAHLDATFGPEPGKLRGYPGHPEVELALMTLHRCTGDAASLRVAQFFIDERGSQPHYYLAEAARRGQPADPANPEFEQWLQYNQSHLPVREQATAEGHAVRGCYLYAGMADVAIATGDDALLAACRRIWDDIVSRKMYVIGGIGSEHRWENFTFPHDLPNASAYAETCAAISLILFGARLLAAKPRGDVADVIERALYNGILCGVSPDGQRFFYVNPLASHPDEVRYRHWANQRPEWFSCACCPPNVARLLASLGGYLYSQTPDTLWVHLFADAETTVELAGATLTLRQRTEYPWDGQVAFELGLDHDAEFTLQVRLPGWCRQPALSVNGQPVDLAQATNHGYAAIRRRWADGDRVLLDLPMPPERIEAHPQVVADVGRIALQRGPIVYCLEEADNGPRLADLVLPDDAPLQVRHEPSLLGGVPVIQAEGRRRRLGNWDGQLYRPLGASTWESTPLTAIPYFLWANRAPGEMTVWIRHGQ
jgi:DUF1680 family protein